MTRDKAREVAELLLAYADGATLQSRGNEDEEWRDVHNPTHVQFFHWRVKPSAEEELQQVYQAVHFLIEHAKNSYEGRQALAMWDRHRP